jgi:disulfide bond formation protein DsbB
MTFWLLVGIGYVLLMGLGLWLGHYLSGRFPRRGFGQGEGPMPLAPTGPTHAVEWLPLGTAFDRALLPAAFADERVTADVA